jgi:hypothetical protein
MSQPANSAQQSVAAFEPFHVDRAMIAFKSIRRQDSKWAWKSTTAKAIYDTSR